MLTKNPYSLANPRNNRKHTIIQAKINVIHSEKIVCCNDTSLLYENNFKSTKAFILVKNETHKKNEVRLFSLKYTSITLSVYCIYSKSQIEGGSRALFKIV